MRHHACTLSNSSIANIVGRSLRLLTNDEWAAIVKTGQKPADAFIRKTYASTIAKAGDVAGNVLDFTISTQDRDRHRDTVAVNGWDVENFKANPVVLWAHNYDMIPVGKALTIGTSSVALVSRAEFPDQDLNAFGFMVYRLLCEQYLRATSVGFIPMEWTYDEEANGYNILTQELLEYSIVPVPANPNTLQNAIGKGIDLAPYVGWVEKALDEIASPGIKSVNISRDVLERVMKIAKPSSSTTVAGDAKAVAELDPFKALLDSVKTLIAANKAAGKKGDPETCALVAKVMHLHIGTLGFMSNALIESLGFGDDDEPTEDTVAARGLLVRELLGNAVKHLGVMSKAGARHSTGDKAMIKDIHDLCVKLGYECAPKEESDDEKAARVAREKAANDLLHPPTPAADDLLELAIGDDVDLSRVSAAEMGEMIRDTMKSTLAAATGRLD